MSKNVELDPFKRYTLLAERAHSYFKDGQKVKTAAAIKSELEAIVRDNLAEFLTLHGYPEGDFDKYKITVKDPYLLLNPRKEGKNRTISQKKFEFFWHHFEMDSYVHKQVKELPDNYLFDALKSFIYNDKDVNGDLEPGHYILKRMSFNSNFKGHIVVIRMWVYFETNTIGERVLKYRAINAYDQASTSEGEPYKRIRVSEGFVIKNQYNTLLFGSIDYTHLFETEGKSSSNHYPEIVSLHTASPNSSLFVGFSLANYPDYKKPAVTQCYIERLSAVDDKLMTFDEYLAAKPWEKDQQTGEIKIGVRRPTKSELVNLTLSKDDAAHRNIMIPEKSELPD
ncbi:hypothetical protein [Pseudoalteromonas rubra]|uniref:Uncharacterized protein n=1 Tax=Pseudoalteromonas rubra TaxID=43658 RepID=A0A0F4QID2_9GAMM|nr:hypothetical protein [Pseudoalteromonas rubra]KJZ07079.1 hypothetical protein TW77_16470 [Pseudoalteromonas rubra]